MKLSYAALKTFQQCHFRSHLRYDRGLPSRSRLTAPVSGALHGALHLCHPGPLKSQQPEQDSLCSSPAVSLEALLLYFSRGLAVRRGDLVL